MYSYKDQIREDVKDWIENNEEQIDGLDRSEAYEFIYESCWVDDSVTGNASGSYTFSRWKARQNFFNDEDSDEYIYQMNQDGFMSAEEVGHCIETSNWERLDVCIRCWLLSDAVSDALDDMYND